MTVNQDNAREATIGNIRDGQEVAYVAMATAYSECTVAALNENTETNGVTHVFGNACTNLKSQEAY